MTVTAWIIALNPENPVALELERTLREQGIDARIRQAVAQRKADILCIKSLTVVTYLQNIPVGCFPQADIDRAGAGMFGNIGQRFLADMK